MKSQWISNSLVPAGTGYPSVQPTLLKVSEGDRWLYLCAIVGKQVQQNPEPCGIAVLDNFVMTPDNKAIALTAMQFVGEDGKVVADTLDFYASAKIVRGKIYKAMEANPDGALLFLVIDTRSNLAVRLIVKGVINIVEPSIGAVPVNPLVFA